MSCKSTAVLFCSLIKGAAPKIRRLRFVLNSHALFCPKFACYVSRSFEPCMCLDPARVFTCQYRTPAVDVLFCSLIKGITPKICMFFVCLFFLINSVLLNFVCFGILIVFSLPVACCRRRSRILVLFCSLIKGIFPKIRMLRFVLNSHALFCPKFACCVSRSFEPCMCLDPARVLPTSTGRLL